VNLPQLRRQIAAGRVRIEFVLPHALTEAFKDGLTVDELKAGVLQGELIENYGTRALLLAFTIPDQIPYHIVVEYFPRDPVTTVITTYVPSTTHWERGWRRRKRPRREESR
jgi:hypothetical protein